MDHRVNMSHEVEQSTCKDPKLRSKITYLLLPPTLLVVIFSLASLLDGCRIEKSLLHALENFDKNFVEPIERADIEVVSVSYCKHSLRPPRPTTLYVFAQLDAPVQVVADVLDDRGMRLVGGPKTYMVQQYPGKPQLGWFGDLEPIASNPGTSELSMSGHGFKREEAGYINGKHINEIIKLCPYPTNTPLPDFD